MEHLVDVAPRTRLWVEERGDPATSPVLLVMGAASSGLVWPEELVDRLARRHRVLRYDHRDTGRSSWSYDEQPYPLRELAEDAVRVLDALAVERAHVVGMSMGGLLTQLLLLDHPDRLRSATLFCTGPLAGAPGAADLPGPAPELLGIWATMSEPRDADAELAWRVAHWRVLNGNGVPFDDDAFQALERRVTAHAGRADMPIAHAHADQAGLDRGAELAGVRVPTLVVAAPEDPAYPPPTASVLAAAVGAAVVTVPGMGHALADAVLDPLAGAIEEHLAATDAG